MGKQQKLFGPELIKFIATLMITNSHLKDFYIDPYKPLGTFGAPGNALFFFVSGFALTLGRMGDFLSWFKRRLSRLFPSVLVMVSLIGPLFFGYKIEWHNIWLSSGFWFIKCIVVYYVIFWLIHNKAKNALPWFAVCGFFVTIIYFFLFSPVDNSSIYQNELHYLCFFSVMIMGGWMSMKKETYSTFSLKKDLLLCFLSFVLFYLIQYIGKGKPTPLFYIQIVSLIPLHTFIFYFYKVCMNPKTEALGNNKILDCIIRFVASLTLEIYIVGFIVFSLPFTLREIFPLNIIVIFFIILALAYLIKVLSNFVVQTIKDMDYDWKKIVKPY